MIAFLYVLVCLCVLILIRNDLVHKHKQRRNNYIYKHNIARINAGLAGGRLDYEKDGGDYDSMMFDLTKWTYEQFYKDEA